MKIDKIPAVTLTQNNIQNHQNQVLKQIIAKQNTNGLINQDLSQSKTESQDLKMSSQELKNLTPLENQIKEVLESSKLPVTKDQIANIKQLLIGLQSTKEKALVALKDGNMPKFTELVGKEVTSSKQATLNQMNKGMQNVELLQKGDSSISVSGKLTKMDQTSVQNKSIKSESAWVEKGLIEESFSKDMPQKVVSLKQVQLPVTVKNIVIQNQFLDKNQLLENINQNIANIKNHVDQMLKENVQKNQMMPDQMGAEKQSVNALDKSLNLHTQISAITKDITLPINMTKEDMDMVREMTEEVHRVIEESGDKASGKMLMSDLAQLQDTTNFYELINQEMSYEMIPIVIEEREHQTEFFVKKKQSGDKEKDFYKVALALETFNLGEIDCVLTQNKERIEVEIRVPDEKTKIAFDKHMDLLEQKIKTIANDYNIHVKIKSLELDMQNFLEEEIHSDLDMFI